MLNLKCLFPFLFLWLALPCDVKPFDRDTEIQSNLLAGVARIDITPPIGIPLAGYSGRDEGATGIRDPLRSAVLVLDDGRTRAAIVTLDLIGVGYAETDAVRRAIAGIAGIPEGNILVTASHTHAGPHFSIETDYGRQVVDKIAGAASVAVRTLRPVRLTYDEDTITFCVNRRLVNAEGIAEMRPNPDGPADRRVKVLRIDDAPSSLTPMAVLMHAVCHPNVFRHEYTRISADFPGEAQRFVEKVFDGHTKTLFLQGPSGDIRPDLPSQEGFRSGTEADLLWAGIELGSAVVRASARAAVQEPFDRRPSVYSIQSATRSILLPGKEDSVRVDMQALRVGNYLFLTLPGEPFVEYGFYAEDVLGDRVRLFVVGYANGAIGYICTEDSYQYEGYEPSVSRLMPLAEGILKKEMVSLAEEVLEPVER